MGNNENTSTSTTSRHVFLDIMVCINLPLLGAMIMYMVGLVISFGCFKSSCPGIIEQAPLWLPAASLILSIPLAVLIIRITTIAARRVLLITLTTAIIILTIFLLYVGVHQIIDISSVAAITLLGCISLNVLALRSSG